MATSTRYSTTLLNWLCQLIANTQLSRKSEEIHLILHLILFSSLKHEKEEFFLNDNTGICRFQGTEDYNSYLNRVYTKSDPLLLDYYPLAWISPASPSISILKHVTDS